MEGWSRLMDRKIILSRCQFCPTILTDSKISWLKPQKVILWARQTDSKMYMKKKTQNNQYSIEKEEQYWRIELFDNFTILSSSLASGNPRYIRWASTMHVTSTSLGIMVVIMRLKNKIANISVHFTYAWNSSQNFICII